MVMENNINKNLFRMVCNQFNSIIALTSIANRNIKLACTPISMQKLPNKIIFFSLHLMHGSFFHFVEFTTATKWMEMMKSNAFACMFLKNKTTNQTNSIYEYE